MKLVFVLAGLCLTSVSFATTAPTPYSILKNLFNTAAMPIDENDVDLATAESNQRCSLVFEKEMETILPGNIIRFDVVIAGEPSNGPLFPGTPDRTESVIIINRETARNGNTALWGKVAQHVKKSVGPTEIIEEINHATLSDSPFVLKLRKNQNIVFEATSYKGLPNQTVFYGYCYR
ncbi:MAG: hypothetical protein AABY64_06805 [Bdellovibrionota bacterium]